MGLIQTVILGAGLSMDSFALSVANGMCAVKRRFFAGIMCALCFGFFQGALTTLGYAAGAVFAQKVRAVDHIIALLLLSYIGIKMILEGVRGQEETESLHGRGLILQGVATSIDALSVGFAIEEYSFPLALTEALIIGIVTFGLCSAGLYFGRKIGSSFSGKATVAGGIILILIGLEIWITGIT